MDKDKQFQKDLKHLYDQQVLDRETQGVLRLAAKSALDEIDRKPRHYWFPATAFASLIAVIMLVWLSGPPHTLPLEVLDELAIISSEDEFELFQELEFYIWLDDETKV